MFAPVYNLIADQIKDDIQSKRWEEKLPGVGKLSKHYSAAPKTISKAISVLADEGLVTTHGTRGTFITQTQTKRPRYGTIGVVGLYPKLQTSRDLEAANQTALRFGYHLMLLGMPSTMGDHVNYLHEMPVDGLIFSHSTLNEQITVNLRRAQMPFVSLNRIDDIPGVPWVDYDNEQALDIAVDHLTDLGHQRIALVGMKYSLEEHQRRMHDKYQQLTEEKGDYDPALWQMSGDQYYYWDEFPEAPYWHYGRDMMRLFLEMKGPPTAIMTRYPMAQGMRDMLREAGEGATEDFAICVLAYKKEQQEDETFMRVATDDTQRFSRAIEALVDMTVRPAKKPLREFVPYKLLDKSPVANVAPKACEPELVAA